MGMKTVGDWRIREKGVAGLSSLLAVCADSSTADLCSAERADVLSTQYQGESPPLVLPFQRAAEQLLRHSRSLP